MCGVDGGGSSAYHEAGWEAMQSEGIFAWKCEQWMDAAVFFFFHITHDPLPSSGGGAEGDKGLSLPRSESRTEQGQLACRSGLCRAVRVFL